MRDRLFRYLILLGITFSLCQTIGFLSAQAQTDTASPDLKLKSPLEETSKINTVSEQTLPSSADNSKDQVYASSKEYLLNNGLKVILIKDKAFPFVSCFTWYKVGSKDDPAGMTGLTHLVEHLLFQNIGNFNGNQWANTVVRSGGEFSGFTSEDFTAFYSNLPIYQLELAIRGEAARMRSAHFTKSDVVKELEHLVKEEKAEEQDSMRMLNREVHALAYERHPYRNPPGGWRHELERLTYNDAKNYYDKYFYPNNASLVLVGNFNEDTAIKLIDKHFGSIPRSEIIPVNVYPQERPQLAERQIRLKGHTGKESIILAYRVVGMSDADAPVFSVLEQYLNLQIAGSFQYQLIDSGLCSSVQVAFEQKRDASLLLIKLGGIVPDSSDKVMQTVELTINQLRDKQLSDTEVSSLVKQTEFNYYCDADGPYKCAFQTGFFSTLAKTDEIRLWPKKILQVKAADILRVARLYLSEDNRVLGHIAAASTHTANEKSKAELVSQNLPLKDTLANDHFRLAAYESGMVKPSKVPVLNTTSVKNKPLVLTTAVNDENAKTEDSQPYCITLRNGLRVIVLESHLNPLVQIYGSVKAGSAYEHPGVRGTSKLLSQLFDRGNINPNQQQLVAAQNSLGMPPEAMLKFDSGVESIIFHSKCLSKDSSLQLKQLFTCLMEPSLQNNDFEATKVALTLALRRVEKNPETRIERAFLKSLIASNSIYSPLHPEEEINSVNNLKLGDLIDFYHERVNPTNTTIFVCGDVRINEVRALLEQITAGWILNTQLYTSSINAKNQRPPELILSKRKAYKSSLITSPSSPAEVIFGRIIPVNNKEQIENYWAAMLVADCALSGHPVFSHMVEQYNLKPELFTELIDDPWNTKITKLEDKLIWSLNIHLLPKSSSSNAVNAIEQIFSEFGKFGLRQEEVLEAKKYLIGSLPIKRCANLYDLTHFVFQGATDLNEITPIIKMQKTINSLKYEDINGFIVKVFKPELSTLTVAGPMELIKQVRPVIQNEIIENSSD